MTAESDTERTRQTIFRIMQETAFARALDMTLVSAAAGVAVLKIPYQEKLVGNPDTGIVHGGVITSLLDHTLGCAVFSALETLELIATLDLRIDYMRAAEPGRDIFAHAAVTKIATSIAFASGTAYHDEPGDPIATSTAAFMIVTDNGRKAGASRG